MDRLQIKILQLVPQSQFILSLFMLKFIQFLCNYLMQPSLVQFQDSLSQTYLNLQFNFEAYLNQLNFYLILVVLQLHNLYQLIIPTLSLHYLYFYHFHQTTILIFSSKFHFSIYYCIQLTLNIQLLILSNYIFHIQYLKIFQMIPQSLFFLLIVYSLYKIIRRKLCSPNFEGKVIWVTGASSGIGQAMAQQFNRRGGKVIISARNQRQLERVKSESPFPQKIEIVKMDIAQFEQVRLITQGVLKQLKEKGQRLDILVENAGISMRCDFVEYPFSNYQSLFNVNVHGPFNHIQCLVKHMIQEGGGQIVGTSSIAGRLSTAYRYSYTGSKNAMIGLLDSLRTQLSPFGITVTNIMPGYIKTNISKNALAANEGQKFGITDKNIQNGMDVNVFARQAVKVIFRKQNEAQISKQWYAPWAIALRAICPDLIYLGVRLKSKNQSKATKTTSQKKQN